jgi:rubredoxin
MQQGEAMTGIEDRIAGVLRKALSLGDFDGDQLYEGGTIDLRGLAAAVVAELQLTQELVAEAERLRGENQYLKGYGPGIGWREVPDDEDERWTCPDCGAICKPIWLPTPALHTDPHWECRNCGGRT